MLLADHLLALVLVVLGPLRSGTMGMRRLRRARPEDLSSVRRSVYTKAIVVEWALAAGTLVLWGVTRRGLGELGLAPRLTGGMLGALVGTAAIAALLLRQHRQALADGDALAAVRTRLRGIEPMLPRTRSEWHGFARLSVTAGVCEELLYRGYLFWYFSHVMPWWAAAAVAAFAFGLGHAYQGPRGVAVTTVVGAFLAAVYLVSGSLFASMAIHMLMDLHSGYLAWKALEQEDRMAEAPADTPNAEVPTDAT